MTIWRASCVSGKQRPGKNWELEGAIVAQHSLRSNELITAADDGRVTSGPPATSGVAVNGCHQHHRWLSTRHHARAAALDPVHHAIYAVPGGPGADSASCLHAPVTYRA